MAQGVYDYLSLEAPAQATREHLLRAHSAAHIDSVLARPGRAELRRIDDDTFLARGAPDAALYAAGAVVHAVERVVDGAVDRAFCNVRPPGHHATRERAMGFCLFNNVAVGALHALDSLGIRRVAILDFDAHDCNGTADILGADPRVLVCSCFQHPLFPFGEVTEPTERLIRCPLAAGSGSESFRDAIESRWLPAVDRFAPELVLVSAGFDGHVREDMSDLRLGIDDYRWVTRHAVTLARRHARGRIVSALEGGYELETLGRAATAHIRVLMGL